MSRQLCAHLLVAYTFCCDIFSQSFNPTEHCIMKLLVKMLSITVINNTNVSLAMIRFPPMAA